MSWKVSITDPMPMTLEFTGTINGDEVSGSVVLGGFGTSSFSGARTYVPAASSSHAPDSDHKADVAEVAKVPGTGVWCLTERTDVPSPTVFRCRTRSFRSSANK